MNENLATVLYRSSSKDTHVPTIPKLKGAMTPIGAPHVTIECVMSVPPCG